MNPDVSVIIPCLNAEAFLIRSVQSALDQESCRVEVIIIDDGSTDGTWETALRLASSDQRIHPFRLNQNSGVSHARNIGIAEASGKWIAVLDADDRFLPKRLSRMISAAEQMDADIALDHLRSYDPETEAIWSPVVKKHDSPCRVPLDEYLYRARPFCGEIDWGLLKPLLKRDFVIKSSILYPEGKHHGEDFLFMIGLLKQGAKCVLIPETGYEYTLRSSGWSRTRIDYTSMVSDSLQLSREEKQQGNKTIATLFLLRASSVYLLLLTRCLTGGGLISQTVLHLVFIFKKPIILIHIFHPLIYILRDSMKIAHLCIRRVAYSLVRKIFSPSMHLECLIF